MIIPCSDLRNKFGSVESALKNSDEPVIITRRGRTSMVLLSYDRFVELMQMEKAVPNEIKERLQAGKKDAHE